LQYFVFLGLTKPKFIEIEMLPAAQDIFFSGCNPDSLAGLSELKKAVTSDSEKEIQNLH
jgi:hypothetical protein